MLVVFELSVGGWKRERMNYTHTRETGSLGNSPAMSPLRDVDAQSRN